MSRFMAKDPNKLLFLNAKEDAIENLEAIRLSLVRCIDEGMIDEEDLYYNELLALIDEASIADSWDELEEVITKGKTLEIDVSNWLSRHGRSNLSLPWPKIPQSQ